MNWIRSVRPAAVRRQLAAALGIALLAAGIPVSTAHAAALDVPSRAAALSKVVTETHLERYIRHVYEDLFGRQPDATGMAGWSALITGGAPRNGVANAITSSDEFRSGLIASAYDWYLRRTPDATGLRFWLDKMGQGWTIAQIEAGFVASDEYYANAQAQWPGITPNAGWIKELYLDVLERPSSEYEDAYWLSQLTTGQRGQPPATRSGVAFGFLLSAEHLNSVVDGYYLGLLGRNLDPTGQQGWVSMLQAGGRDEVIIGGIVASDEYWGYADDFSRLVLSPSAVALAAGGSLAYSVAEFDVDNNPLGDVTSAVSFAVDGDPAACVGNVCQPTAVGDHQVTATDGILTGTVPLRVINPGAVRSTASSWGVNGHGQLGNSTTTTLTSPTRLGIDTHWATVAVSNAHALALKTDGSLWAWGANANGQLGDGSTADRSTPTRIGTGTDWTGIGVGDYHSAAIKADGTLWAWGYNSAGQVGDGTLIDRSAPARVGSSTDWASVSGGRENTVAVTTGGTLWAWGDNIRGTVGDSTTTTRSAPVRLGTDSDWASADAGFAHTLARKTDGTLWAWGWNLHGVLGTPSGTDTSAPARVGTGTTWTSVSAGASQSMAITADGALWAWGDNTSGLLGDGTQVDRPAPVRIGAGSTWRAVSAGQYFNAAVTTAGTLWTWGIDAGGPVFPVQVGTGTRWTSVGAGDAFRVALSNP